MEDQEIVSKKRSQLRYHHPLTIGNLHADTHASYSPKKEVST